MQLWKTGDGSLRENGLTPVPDFVLRAFLNRMEDGVFYRDVYRNSWCLRTPEEAFRERNLFREAVLLPENPVEVLTGRKKLEEECGGLLSSAPFKRPVLQVPENAVERLKVFFVLRGAERFILRRLKAVGQPEALVGEPDAAALKTLSVWRESEARLNRARSTEEILEDPVLPVRLKTFFANAFLQEFDLFFVLPAPGRTFEVSDAWPTELFSGDRTAEESLLAWFFPVSPYRMCAWIRAGSGKAVPELCRFFAKAFREYGESGKPVRRWIRLTAAETDRINEETEHHAESGVIRVRIPDGKEI